MKDIKQDLIDWKGRKVLMVVYPHPDDETMGAGGLLLIAKKLGWKTIAVILTKGGAGQMCIHPHGCTVKEVRTKELERAAKLLHLDKLVVEDFDDGKLKQQSLWKKWVSKIIELHRPGWVVTYDHSGITGHPDHISVSLALRQVPAKLYWTTFPNLPDVGNSDVDYLRSTPTHVLNLGLSGINKWLAMKSHSSQKLPGLLTLYRYEWYHEVEAKRAYKHKFVDFKI